MPEDLITTQVTGAKEVIDAFRELQTQLPRNTVPAALRKAARYLAAQLQLAAPVGGGRGRDPHPGRLQASIVVATRRSGAAVGVRGPAFYWRFLESGWRSRAGNFFRYPFAANVVRANFNTVLRIVVDDVERRIERLNNRGA